MTEDFKKWLFQVQGQPWGYSYGQEPNKVMILKEVDLEILIKALWSINRQGKWAVENRDTYIFVCERKYRASSITDKTFFFDDHNNSEQEALTEALKYVFDNRKKERSIEDVKMRMCGNKTSEVFDNTNEGE